MFEYLTFALQIALVCCVVVYGIRQVFIMTLDVYRDNIWIKMVDLDQVIRKKMETGKISPEIADRYMDYTKTARKNFTESDAKAFVVEAVSLIEATRLEDNDEAAMILQDIFMLQFKFLATKSLIFFFLALSYMAMKNRSNSDSSFPQLLDTAAVMLSPLNHLSGLKLAGVKA